MNLNTHVVGRIRYLSRYIKMRKEVDFLQLHVYPFRVIQHCENPRCNADFTHICEFNQGKTKHRIRTLIVCLFQAHRHQQDFSVADRFKKINGS